MTRFVGALTTLALLSLPGLASAKQSLDATLLSVVEHCVTGSQRGVFEALAKDGQFQRGDAEKVTLRFEHTAGAFEVLASSRGASGKIERYSSCDLGQLTLDGDAFNQFSASFGALMQKMGFGIADGNGDTFFTYANCDRADMTSSTMLLYSTKQKSMIISVGTVVPRDENLCKQGTS